MPQISKRKLKPEVKRKIVGDFLTFIEILDSQYEVISILTKFLTYSEFITLAKRLEIAIFLFSDKSYEEISQVLCVSSSTVAKVHNLLKSETELYRIIKKIYIDKPPEQKESEKLGGLPFKTPTLGKNLMKLFFDKE